MSLAILVHLLVSLASEQTITPAFPVILDSFWQIPLVFNVQPIADNARI